MKPYNQHYLVHLAGIACLAGLCAIFWFAVIKPFQGSISQNIQTSKTLNELRDTHVQLTRQINQVQIQTNQDQSNHQYAQAITQKRRAINHQIDELLSDLSQNQLHIESIQPGTIYDCGPFVATPIQITGQTAWAAFIQQLNTLHAQHPDTRVYSLAIENNQRRQEHGANTQIGLIWYTLPD